MNFSAPASSEPPPTLKPAQSKRNKGIFPFPSAGFSIDHRGCAMKVGMDAMVLGGYCSSLLPSLTEVSGLISALSHLSASAASPVSHSKAQLCDSERKMKEESSLPWPRRVLDIGTGSGVLGLMTAFGHKDVLSSSSASSASADTPSIILLDADEPAVIQSRQNVESFSKTYPEVGSKIAVIHFPLQSFTTSSPDLVHSFDLIISNPPYFENNGHILDAQRAAARSIDSLPLSDLCSCVSSLLKSLSSSRFCVILPHPHATSELEKQAATHGLIILEEIQVFDNPTTSSSIDGCIRKVFTLRPRLPADSVETESLRRNVVTFHVYNEPVLAQGVRRIHSSEYARICHMFMLPDYPEAQEFLSKKSLLTF